MSWTCCQPSKGMALAEENYLAQGHTSFPGKEITNNYAVQEYKGQSLYSKSEYWVTQSFLL